MTDSNLAEFHIILLRHGESLGNAEGYHQGQAEFPLTDTGLSQAHALADYWLDHGTYFDQIISSPQKRARQTAEIIANALGCEVEFDPIWMERDNGVYAGMSHKEAQIRYPYPEFIPIYERIGHTGESQWELYLRGGLAIQRVLYKQLGHYLVVSHGGILNMTLKAILGIMPQANFQGPRFRFRNTAFASLTYQPDQQVWEIIAVNSRPHWSD